MNVGFFVLDKKFSFDTNIQKEALLNEFKGNLFEYLTGLSFSRLNGFEDEYILSLSEKLKEKFISYDRWLWNNDPYLQKRLPILAQDTAGALFDYVDGGSIDSIRVIGKEDSLELKQNYHEGDLLLVNSDGVLPVSLKLCKYNSFVNTKSGGIKSFIEKYFSVYKESSRYQKELNMVVERCFLKMGHELYGMLGMDFSEKFGPEWSEALMPELPGQLDQEMREVVLSNYHEVILVLYGIFEELASDEHTFKKCLLPLLGLSNDRIIQCICFHGDGYQQKGIRIHDIERIMSELKSIRLGSVKEAKSSFEIFLEDFILQIRIKPMNKFIVPAHKVNCSVRYNGR